MIINDEEKMLAFLKVNPGNINVIGEELLNRELLKRKKGKESKILDLLEKQKKCYIYATSSDYIKNNEYIILKYLEFNDASDINFDLIGKELLQKELNKGFEEDGKPKSEILNRIINIFEKNINIQSKMPEILKNNTEFMKYLVEKIDILYMLYVDEKVFNDLWQHEEIRKKAENELKLNSYCSDFIKNNKIIIEISLKNDWKTLNYIGKKEFDNHIEQYKDNFYLISNSLPHIKKNKKAIEYTINNRTGHFLYIDHDILMAEFKKVLNSEESALFEQLAQSLEIKDKDVFYKALKELFEKNNSVLFNININLLRERYSIIRPYLSLICNDMKLQDAIFTIQGHAQENIIVLGNILNFITRWKIREKTAKLYSIFLQYI